METLDKFDLAILNELQADGRLTNAELANRVGLSAAPCWRRVRALEEAGFITGYRAELNRNKIGLGVLAFVRLDAERNSGDALGQMEKAIRQIPEIVSCHYISGSGTFGFNSPIGFGGASNRLYNSAIGSAAARPRPANMSYRINPNE